MATMSKNEKFQLELLRHLIEGKDCYRMHLTTPTSSYDNLYGWGQVFRAVDPLGFFLHDTMMNQWKPVELTREADCMICKRDPDSDFDVKVGRGKKHLICFDGGDGFGKVYIDSKYLDYFEDDCLFLMRNHYDMVLVWKDGNLVGGVMPFVAKK